VVFWFKLNRKPFGIYHPLLCSLGPKNAALQIAAPALLFRGRGRGLLQISRLFLSNSLRPTGPTRRYLTSDQTGEIIMATSPFYAYDGTRYALIDASPARPLTVTIRGDGTFTISRP
jgi:hypothetical protein